MCRFKMRPPHKCVLFLRDEKDISLLQPETYLFGQFVEQTGIILMAPYPPPSASFPVIGVFQKQTG
jgi:hypothetical protein